MQATSRRERDEETDYGDNGEFVYAILFGSVNGAI